MSDGTLLQTGASPPLSLVVRLWFDAKGQPVSCDIGQSSLPQAAQTGCAQAMRSARFSLFPGMALPFRRGFVDVDFSFFKGVPHDYPGRQVYAMPIPGYANTTIAYPADEVPADQFLKPADGAFRAAVSFDSYPAIAARYGFESHSKVLLGISRDGGVQSCRPVTGSSLPNRTAYLDNYTCAIFVRRGHFEFLASAPAYAGLRYWRQEIRWMQMKD